MITKVVIAAAGQGTRMQHLSKNKSKHLIKVNQRPFLAYVLGNLLKAGYKDFILVTGYRSDLIEDFIKENGYKATVVDQFKILGPKEKIYGTACALMCVKDIVKDEQFLFVSGDNLYSAEDLKSMNVEDGYNYVAGIEHENPEKYGVLVRRPASGYPGDFLDKIVEKPKDFVGNLINAGLYKFTPDVFKELPKIKKSVRGEYEITDVLSLLAKDKKVKIKIIKDYWKDFGNPGDIIKLSKFLQDGNNNTNAEKP